MAIALQSVSQTVRSETREMTTKWQLLATWLYLLRKAHLTLHLWGFASFIIRTLYWRVTCFPLDLPNFSLCLQQIPTEYFILSVPRKFFLYSHWRCWIVSASLSWRRVDKNHPYNLLREGLWVHCNGILLLVFEPTLICSDPRWKIWKRWKHHRYVSTNSSQHRHQYFFWFGTPFQVILCIL